MGSFTNPKSSFGINGIIYVHQLRIIFFQGHQDWHWWLVVVNSGDTIPMNSG